MPSNLMLSEQALPKFTEGQGDRERIAAIYNYLYMLLEQLRYTFANLGRENINDTEFEVMADTITEPLFLRLEDTDGNVSVLQNTAELLASRIQNAEGDISSLVQTASSLTSRIEGAEGSITEISQTVHGLTFTVENGSSYSMLRLLANGIELTSANIAFTGVVTFGDLENEGFTTINGSNIKTGKIKAIEIDGCDITGSLLNTILEADGTVSGAVNLYYIDKDYLAGGIRLDDTGAGTEIERQYRMFLYTNEVNGVPFAMKLQSAGGVSIETPANIWQEAGTEICLVAPDVQIDNCTINTPGGHYTFTDGGIYFNGELLVSTAAEGETT